MMEIIDYYADMSTDYDRLFDCLFRGYEVFGTIRHRGEWIPIKAKKQVAGSVSLYGAIGSDCGHVYMWQVHKEGFVKYCGELGLRYFDPLPRYQTPAAWHKQRQYESLESSQL